MKRRFSAALCGILRARGEWSLRVQAVYGIAAVLLGWVLGLSRTEWVAVIGAIAAVLSLELMNTAIEKLCDRLCPERDAAIGAVKDIAAGAVLTAAIGAAVIGCVIFLPKIYAALT